MESFCVLFQGADQLTASVFCTHGTQEDVRKLAADTFPGAKIHCAFSSSLRGSFFAYSPNEQFSNNAGYWNNDMGWVDEESASLYTLEQVLDNRLPLSTGNDCTWMFRPRQQWQIGDEAFWTDPDNGLCSEHVIVMEIVGETIIVAREDQTTMEVFEHELS